MQRGVIVVLSVAIHPAAVGNLRKSKSPPYIPKASSWRSFPFAWQMRPGAANVSVPLRNHRSSLGTESAAISKAPQLLRSWKSGESPRVKDGAIVETISFHPTAAGKWRKSKVRRKCSVPFAWMLARAREDGKARAANVSVPRRKRSGARGWWRRRRCASAHRSWRRSTDPSCSI